MRSLRRWSSPAVGAVVLAIVIGRLGTGPFLAGLRAVDARAVLAAAAVVLVTTLCSAWRWTIVARGLGLRLPFRAAVAAYYRALFLNLTLPGGVAGDVHRGLSHGREARDVGRALRAVVWERVAGQVVQVVLAISVLLMLPSPVRASMPLVLAAAIAVFLGVLLIGRLRIGDGGSRWTRARSVVAADVRDGVLRRSSLLPVLLTSVVVAVGHTITFLIAARTAGATAPISRLVPLALVAVLATALPNIGGWGPREGVLAWVFSAAGLGAALGAATAVAFGVLVLAASLPGAAVLIVERLPRRRVSVARRRRFFLRPEGAADA
ncbi:MAG TPA: lysylphosphatidylglycerol synthase domain-containing protein [Gaiellaceae bacterium]|nr:lysylphosphatidylglycerol synthase domain-containing protein [Gaiellaceae bacterium]